jgi:hypothetical protein
MFKNSITVGNVFTIPLRSACRLLVSCLAYPSIRKIVAVHSSETSVDFYRTTRRCIPEDTVTAVRCSKPKLERTVYHGTSDLSGILTDVAEYFCGISLVWPRETRHCTPLAAVNSVIRSLVAGPSMIHDEPTNWIP